MRTCLIVIFILGCGGAKKPGPQPQPEPQANPPSADSPEAKPAAEKEKYCTKDDICYEDVDRANYESDDELMCDQYCTTYCICYEEIEGEDCNQGGQCAAACVEQLENEASRAEWLKRVRCAQEAECKRFMDEC